ncbi:MAG: hypothetical protein ABEJ03_04835 [Candidatus Nanohaloarchaea archaeon]
MSNLLRDAKKKNLRELAKNRDKPEKALDSDLKDLGFRRITEFIDNEENQDQTKLLYQLSDLEKRKLQGLFGEKISVFVEGKIKRFLRRTLSENWELKNNIRLKTGDTRKSLNFGEKPDRDSINISGSNVSHYGTAKAELIERVQKQHYSCTEYLFEKFQQYQIPTIDNTLYAIKKSGETEKFKYDFIDHSKNQAQIKKKTREIALEKLEDFKIIGLEVKTSDSEAKNLLSTKQREIRDMATDSAFLEIYTVKVDFDYGNGELPQKVPVNVQRLDSS